MASAGTITLTSVLPVAATQTLTLVNEAGATVRTLVNGSRGAGTYTDTWDGKDGAGQRLPDGLYRWISTVNDGTNQITLDDSAKMHTEYQFTGGGTIAAGDSFNNAPITGSYTNPYPAQVWFVYATVYHVLFGPSCDPPFFCQYLGYQPSGTLDLEWAETDGNGAYRPDMKAVLFASYRTAFPRNGIAVAGGAVKVRRTRVSRPVFSPGSQTQEIRADLTVHPGETADVTVEIINHETLSVVKSVSLAGQTSGTVLVTWDGRSASGLLAAPGGYTVRTRAVSRFGETAVSDILMQVDY